MAEYIVGTDEHEGHWLTGERIVRCRDCKHFEYVDKVCNRFGEYPSAVGTWFAVNHSGFCAWGEPKEGE